MTAAAAPVGPIQPRRSLWIRTRNARTAYLYLLPALIVMGAITFYPLLFQVWMSFTDFSLRNLRPGAEAPPYVGLDNYINILQSNLAIPNFSFVRLILFNLWWAFSNVVIHVILGVFIALLLNTPGFKFRRFYRALFILPVVIPPIIVATVWRNMFDPDNGAINMFLQGTVGFLFRIPPDAFRIDWLRQVQDPIPFIPLPLAYFALLTANTWLGWPLNAVVATGALQSIPRELYEAAEMDGANWWNRFKAVTLPFLRPAMLPYAIYGFVITFNLFHLSYFMSGGGPFGRTELLVTQAYRLVNEQRLYGAAAAFSVIMFFILLSITLVVNRAAKATASYDI
jgi:arabinogalactan oligomer/maltooligosaccharide transport system permease protein